MKNQNINIELWEKIAQHPRLGEILIQHKKLTISQLTEALDSQNKEYRPIGEILIQMGIITKNELVEVLELQSRIDKILDESIEELKKLKDE